MKTIEEYDNEWKQNSAICSSCGEFNIQPEDVWFDEQGSGYGTKLTRCAHCGKIVILGFIEDYGLDVNNDKRYYEYK